jgi:cyclic pyranopterin phosphate synthase
MVSCTCLFATEGMDFKTPMRQGVAYQAPGNQIKALWQSRQDQYSQLHHLNTDSNVRKIEVSYIGG